MTSARISTLLTVLLLAASCGGGKDAPVPPCLCGGTCAADGSCVSCDGALAIDGTDATQAAAAMGICRNLVSASWVQPDGSAPPASDGYALGHGLLASLGPNVGPREGTRLLALSTGTARSPSDPGFQSTFADGFDKGYVSAVPAGFPAASPACAGVVPAVPHDAAALELTLTVPPGARGLAFDYKFYTADWPAWVCTSFADQFVALVSPAPAGRPDGNIALDLQGNPVGALPTVVDVCGCSGSPCQAGGLNFFCSLGTAELTGTGFDEAGAPHGGSPWITATTAVSAGSTVRLRLAIWDSGDGASDSTVLVDNFRWTE